MSLSPLRFNRSDTFGPADRTASRAADAAMIKKAVKRFMKNGGKPTILPSFKSEPMPPYNPGKNLKPRKSREEQVKMSTRMRDGRTPISLDTQREHFKDEVSEIMDRLKLRESFAGLSDITVTLVLELAEQLMSERQISNRARIPARIVRNVLLYHGIVAPKTREEAVRLHKQLSEKAKESA